MQYNEKKQYSHYGNFRRRKKEKGTEDIFKAIIAENFLNLGREYEYPDPSGPKNPK